MASAPLRILVAWRPGSDGSESVAYAAWLAHTCQVRVRFVVVLSRGWPLLSLARSTLNDSWVNDVTESTTAAIKRAWKAGGLRKGMLDKDPIEFIEDSSEATAILRSAADFEADLVMLSSGEGGRDGYFRAGSTADALLHCSNRPLALAPSKPELSKRGVARVNCSYIDTPQSHKALAKAADLAHKWSVPLRLVAFTPTGATMYRSDIGYGTSDDLMVEWHEQALALLDRGRDRALTRHPELQVEAAVASGDGWEASISSIKWKKGDLLAIGSSTLGTFGRVFIGSSTNQIVRNSRVPMLITTA